MFISSLCASTALWLFAAGLFEYSACAQNALDLRGKTEAHDPSTIIKCKDRYYTFHTGQGILSSSSADKVFWSPGPCVFPTAPAWTTNAVPKFTGTFWAPDIKFFNNRYHLYYSVSSWGSQVSAIGLATNTTLDPSDPACQWVDQGVVIQSGEGSPFNTIDPGITFDAQGNLWMVFGSYWSGIYLVQLDPATGMRISPGSPTHRLAWNSSIEAAWIYWRNGYYYLFVNWGSCCAGVKSSYNVRVGRSPQITGPYLDANGVDMIDRGGTLFMRASGKHVGPGHIGVLTENSTELFSFHYYDANSWSTSYKAYGTARLGLAPLLWTADGWPCHSNEWSAVYNFRHDARDENNRYYGLLKAGSRVLGDPERGRALDLNGTQQYVWLPPGLAYAQTVSAVVKWRGGAKWQRIFDFGFDSSKTFMLTPSGGTSGVLRCDLNPGGDLDIVQWDRPLPSNVWTHVAVTVDGSQGILYVDGSPVATNSAMNRLPLEGAFQTNHLGRSKFPLDPFFDGCYARLSVHSRPLSAAEIVAPVAQIDTPADGAQYNPGSTVCFSGSGSDFMALALSPSSMTWSVRHIDGGATNLVFGPLSGEREGSFNAAATSGLYQVTLSVSDTAGRHASKSVLVYPGTNWSSYYSFNTSGQDASNNFNASLFNGASIQNDSTRGNVLNLSGGGQFASLPTGAAAAQTISAWVYWRGGNAWQRAFDFGVSTSSWFHFNFKDASGMPEIAITADAQTYVRTVELPEPFPINEWTHIAFVADGRQGILYWNGVAMAVNNSLTLLPSDVVGPNAYLGRSQYSADPYLNGCIDALKLSSAALKPEQIFAPATRILTPAPGSLFTGGSTLSLSGEAFSFSEAPLPGNALSWTIELHTNGQSATVFGPSGGNSASYAVPATGPLTTNMFYRVKLLATDSSDFEQKAEIDASPQITRLTFETVPPGLLVAIDGQGVPHGISLDLVSGFQRVFVAPSPQTLDGKNYSFVLWSDGHPATHMVQVPRTNAIFTSSFLQPQLNVVPVAEVLELAWPSWAQTLQLYSATNLAGSVWTPEPMSPVYDAGMLKVQVQPAEPCKFYRLQ